MKGKVSPGKRLEASQGAGPGDSSIMNKYSGWKNVSRGRERWHIEEKTGWKLYNLAKKRSWEQQ